MNFSYRDLFKLAGLPPMFLLWVLLMGLLFKPWLAWMALVLLYLLSISPVASLLLRTWETIPPLTLPIEHQQNTVIVVLGAGMPRISPERKGFRPSPYTLDRLRHGSWLQKQTGLPLLVTGGGFRPEATTMADSLEQDFGVEVQWREAQSRNTWENAAFSRAMLPEHIDRVILVTHAWHMPRSVWSFEQQGFTVLPAPTAFTEVPPMHRWSTWLPNAHNLQKSEQGVKEFIGNLYYRNMY